ncbi:MAG: PEGA domain-containing protein [Terracidiphilus sp.]
MSGTANSTSIGDSTNTQIGGTYSSVRNSSTSGSSIAVYRVYDNLVIEGDDSVYVTSERLRWRWSKAAHVAVNGTIRYYVDGRKLHVLDEDSKEHTIEILKEIRETPSAQVPAGAEQANQSSAGTQASVVAAPSAAVTIDSVPPGADIEVDGGFVGNTPSTITVAPGAHEITVKKTGFADWTRKMNVTGGSVHLDAELEAAKPQ